MVFVPLLPNVGSGLFLKLGIFTGREQTYANADDSTLVAVDRKPADRPAVAASLNRDMG